MDVPIVPLAGLDGHLAPCRGVGIADRLGLLLRDESGPDELDQLRLQGGTKMGGHVVPHLLPHEHAVRADVDDAALGPETGDQLLDLGVDEGFTAADRHHRSIALGSGGEALLERDDVLQAGGILTDASTAGAGEVAGVERLQLQDHRELRGATEAMPDDVLGDLGGQRERKTHGGIKDEWVPKRRPRERSERAAR